MALTKKHFKLFAEIIKMERESLVEDRLRSAGEELSRIIDLMTRIFREENPNFDFAKFYRACGIKP